MIHTVCCFYFLAEDAWVRVFLSTIPLIPNWLLLSPWVNCLPALCLNCVHQAVHVPPASTVHHSPEPTKVLLDPVSGLDSCLPPNLNSYPFLRLTSVQSLTIKGWMEANDILEAAFTTNHHPPMKTNSCQLQSVATRLD